MSVTATLVSITRKPIGSVISGPNGATYQIGQRGRLPSWVAAMVHGPVKPNKPKPAPKSVSPAADKLLGGKQKFDRMIALGMMDTCVTHLKRMASPEIVNAAIKLLSQAVNGDVYIEINKRCRVSAGIAKAKTNPYAGTLYDLGIVFSESIMNERTYEEQFDIVSHEFAHLVDYVVRGTSDHGDFWQNIHKLMGGSGNAFHKFAVKRNVRRYVELVAPNGATYMVSVAKARRYARNGYTISKIIEYDPNTKQTTNVKDAKAIKAAMASRYL
jgi:hypothetical protein